MSADDDQMWTPATCLTLAELCERLQRVDGQPVALSVQFHSGAWLAGVRTERGVGPAVVGRTMVEAIAKLVTELERAP
jgi:hypothetical protein